MKDLQDYSPKDIVIGDRVTVWGNGGAIGANGELIKRGFTIEVIASNKRWNSQAYCIKGYHLTTTGARRKGETIRYAEISGPSGGTSPAQWRMSSRTELEAPVVEESPSAFEGAPPVRTHEDGSQTYGPYATSDLKAAMLSSYDEDQRLPGAPPGAGSSVVVVLERVWGKIREDTPELPDVVIVTGTGMIGPPRWGHFRANGWLERAEGAATNLLIGEMFVAGETLARGAGHTLETMLHEAAHVLAGVRGIKDTSRQGRWHNQKFRALAEELGLEYTRESAHSKIGFSEVTLTPGTREQYAEVIKELDQAIRLTVTPPASFGSASGDGTDQGAGEYMGHHGARKPRGEGGSTTNNVKATCECWPEPRIVRASRKVLEGARITCEECKQAFMDRSE